VGARKFTKEEEKRLIVPIVKTLQDLHKKGSTTIVGMQGGQGTGKSTIVRFIEKHLRKKGYKVKSFSIDDFYKTWTERKKIQKKYPRNPFYQIPRGMPGTHRIENLLTGLRKAKKGKKFEIPIFDKSLHEGKGDVLKKTVEVNSRQDFILFEGWCVGLPNVTSKKLEEICKRNKIGLKKLDPKLKYHKTVLKFIENYQRSWELLDYTIMLKPDSSKVHKEWRLLQERRMIEKKGRGMDKKGVFKLVEPYLPFTYVCYELIKPDVKISIDVKHNYYKIQFT
jgi:D-glycerate 3-kinase